MFLEYSNLATSAVPVICMWLVGLSWLPSSKQNVHCTLFGLLIYCLFTFLLYWCFQEDGAPSASCFTLSSIPATVPSAYSAATKHVSKVRIEKAAAFSISEWQCGIGKDTKKQSNWIDAGLNLSSDSHQAKDPEPVTYLRNKEIVVTKQNRCCLAHSIISTLQWITHL